MAGPVLPTTHDLKVWPEYFAPLDYGTKTFELRLDDRHFAVGDYLRLREWDQKTELYTGRVCWRRVSYVARGGLIPSGFVCMSVQPADPFAVASLETMTTLGERVDDSEAKP